MTVTFVGSFRVHEHGERVIATAHRTITTSDGFEGHGVDSFVDNGQVLKYSLNDIMTNEATGQRFRAYSVFVLDLATDTVRVERFRADLPRPVSLRNEGGLTSRPREMVVAG